MDEFIYFRNSENGKRQKSKAKKPIYENCVLLNEKNKSEIIQLHPFIELISNYYEGNILFKNLLSENDFYFLIKAFPILKESWISIYDKRLNLKLENKRFSNLSISLGNLSVQYQEDSDEEMEDFYSPSRSEVKEIKYGSRSSKNRDPFLINEGLEYYYFTTNYEEYY